MRIDVSLKFGEPDRKTVAFGTVTIDRYIRFIVQVREVTIKEQTQLKVCLPRQLLGDKWCDLFKVDNMKEIENAVVAELSHLVVKDSLEYFPIFKRVELEQVKEISAEGKDKITIIANVIVYFEHYSIRGITLKQYKQDFIVQFPQYKSGHKYCDVIYFLEPKLKKKINVINIVFKESKGLKYRTVVVHTKKARGMMINYIVKNKIENSEKLKEFDYEGYEFSRELSDDNNFVFTREPQILNK